MNNLANLFAKLKEHVFCLAAVCELILLDAVVDLEECLDSPFECAEVITLKSGTEGKRNENKPLLNNGWAELLIKDFGLTSKSTKCLNALE